MLSIHPIYSSLWHYPENDPFKTDSAVCCSPFTFFRTEYALLVYGRPSTLLQTESLSINRGATALRLPAHSVVISFFIFIPRFWLVEYV